MRYNLIIFYNTHQILSLRIFQQTLLWRRLLCFQQSVRDREEDELSVSQKIKSQNRTRNRALLFSSLLFFCLLWIRRFSQCHRVCLPIWYTHVIFSYIYNFIQIPVWGREAGKRAESPGTWQRAIRDARHHNLQIRPRPLVCQPDSGTAGTQAQTQTQTATLAFERKRTTVLKLPVLSLIGLSLFYSTLYSVCIVFSLVVLWY